MCRLWQKSQFEKLGTGKESMWVWECVGKRWRQGKRVCGCVGMWVWEGKRNAEKLKCWNAESGERECVGVWVCGEREMLKSWERECVGLWVWGGEREKS
jgi:hypothetical protein